jgi:enamine deaminase RidA (YjgF/YER057c/UK114 family)
LSATSAFFDDTTQDGNVVGKGDMRAQVEQIGKNIQACLAAAGTSTSAIIKTAAFVTDMEAFQKNADMRARYLGAELPTSTTATVDRLGGPDFLVEMEAVATIN